MSDIDLTMRRLVLTLVETNIVSHSILYELVNRSGAPTQADQFDLQLKLEKLTTLTDQMLKILEEHNAG